MYKESVRAASPALFQNPHMPTPAVIAEQLVVLEFTHWNFEQQIKTGEFVIIEPLVTEVAACTRLAWEIGYPIYQALSPAQFGWCDKASCEANNSAAHNMRYINRTSRLSKHAGSAFDLNPMLNPCFEYDDDGNIMEVIPERGTYDPRRSGTLYKAHPIVQLMMHHGWTWGGTWTNPWDPQHFQKVIPELEHLYN